MTRFIDTNIFIYAFDSEEPHKRNAAKPIVSEFFKGKHCTSLQVLGEFSRVLTEKRMQHPHIAAEILHATGTTHHYSKKTILAALQLQKYKLSFWDAVIAATMLENNIPEIYTEDDAFNRVPGIKAINPFIK